MHASVKLCLKVISKSSYLIGSLMIYTLQITIEKEQANELEASSQAW